MSAANFVVKKNDGTTDVTYTAYQSSAGETSPAIWYGPYLSGAGNSLAHAAQLRAQSKLVNQGKTRQARWTYVGPDVQGSAAPYTVAAPAKVTLVVDMPTTGIPAATWYEAVMQSLNAFKAQADAMKGGNFAP